MEVDDVVDPLELCKNPKVIKDAQEAIGKLDVLVCGECHDVFHFIEPFQEHQKGKCTKISTVRENYKHEPKAQVWAFMLWKNAQLKKTKEGESTPTSWVIYQRWCKLNSEEKDAWVAAGQTIQSFTKISTAKVQEIKAKIATPVVKNKVIKSGTPEAAKNDEDLEEGEIRLSQLTNAQRVAIKAQVASNKSNSDVDPLAEVDHSAIDSKVTEKPKKGNETPKKTPLKPVQLNNDVTIGVKKSPELKKALRTGKNDDTEEAVVERILSRRFNHKKKSMEYFIKWENLNETENTWEPKSHLDKCKALMEEFDKVFSKPKSAPKLTKLIDETHAEHSEAEELPPGGRPQRTSKQKALNQVKVWCGDITEGEDGPGKRKSFSDDDDDSTDSFEKKIKLEEESDSSDEEKPSVTIRRVVKASNSVNGLTKKPEAGFATSTPQRVVRVSQKQLPSLSSGVYIMSKTEGIIKLDSTTPPAGSPLLRVGPKIGQTHIKMVKKEPGSPSSIIRTPVKALPKLVKTSDSRTSLGASKTLTKIATPQRRTPLTTTISKPVIRIIETNTAEKVDSKKQKIEDEDSDGLEELEFPTDLPLPSPDSPPGEFTLCPLTGKILGQSGEPMEQEEPIPEHTSLDILVKQAVAELSDVDMDTSTPNLKPEGGDKGTEEIGATPMIGIETAPAVSVSVPSINSVNVSPVVAVSTLSDASSSTAPAIISSPVGTANVAVTTTTVIAAPITTPRPPTVTAVTPAVAINTASKRVGQSAAATIVSNSKIATKDDIEERLTPSTIERISPKEALTTFTKSRPLVTGTSILNAALTNRAPQSTPNRVGPPKKLLSTTPHTVRQKVTTTVNRSPINRPTVPRPSPNTTIIHKITPNKNRPSALPKAITHPEQPILKRTSNVTTYKPANVARRIGNTTIYKTSEKPQTSSVRTAQITSPPPVVTTVAPTVQPTLIPTTQTVINMPLLTTDEDPATTQSVETLNEIESLPNLPADTGLADLATFSLPDSETPILITGDDGTVYQVAGQNEDGQTILISEGPDGQQQCVLVSSETTNDEVPTLMMEDTAGESEELQQTLMVSTPSEEVETESGDADGEESQVVAQIIKADPPSPGGTRKVVLMLPDGNLMMTDVTAEQYAALELDK